MKKESSHSPFVNYLSNGPSSKVSGNKKSKYHFDNKKFRSFRSRNAGKHQMCPKKKGFKGECHYYKRPDH